MRACWYCHSRRQLEIASVLLLGMLAGGCAKDRACCETCYQPPVVLDCQPVERQPLVADLSLLTNRPQAPSGRSYCNLTERDAQCVAAMQAPNARLLDQEADAVAAQSSGHHGGSTQATEQALRLQAAHERSRNASAAVQLLLRIAAAENGADSLRRQLVEIKNTLADLKRLQVAGLDQPLSPPQTEAQYAETEHKLADVELTIDQLNEQLAMLLGGELPPGSRYWPDVNLQVNPVVPLLEEAQSLAVVQRADLAALRVAASSGPRETATAVRAILGPAAGVGLSAGPCQLLSLLHFRATADEAAIRFDQLYSSIADKQQSVRHEVAQALLTIDTRLNQIAMSQRRTEALRLHQSNLQRSSANVVGASFEIRRAGLAVLAAEQDVFQDVIEWKIAAVKLREAEGELAIDCGYTGVLLANQCCQ